MSWQNNINNWWAKQQFSPKKRISFYRKLSKLMSNGVQILDAMDMLYKQASKNDTKKDEPIAVVINAIRTGLKNGNRIAQSMHGWVPSSEEMMISAGERSGAIESTLEGVCKAIESGSQMKSAILSGIFYPTILLLAAVGVMALFGIKVIPQFAKISSTDTWTGSAAGMAIMSNIVKNYGIYIGLSIGILISSIIYSLPRLTGNIRIYLDKLPPYSLYQLWIGSGFLLSLATLVRAGEQAEKSMMLMREQASPWLKERIDACLTGIRAGYNVGEALDRSGYQFPDQEIIDDLAIYAKLSGFDDAMKLVGEEWMSSGVAKVQMQSAIAKGVATLMMGAVVAWMAFGLFAIQQNLTSAIQNVH